MELERCHSPRQDDQLRYVLTFTMPMADSRDEGTSKLELHFSQELSTKWPYRIYGMRETGATV